MFSPLCPTRLAHTLYPLYLSVRKVQQCSGRFHFKENNQPLMYQRYQEICKRDLSIFLPYIQVMYTWTHTQNFLTRYKNCGGKQWFDHGEMVPPFHFQIFVSSVSCNTVVNFTEIRIHASWSWLKIISDTSQDRQLDWTGRVRGRKKSGNLR